jgi:hypothetical protein
MKMNRALTFLYQDGGQLEVMAFGAHERCKELVTEGHRDSGIPNLMIDLHPDTQQPYCFLSLNFDKSYPVVIWGLRLLMNEERFDIPQAGLQNIPLAEAFSWAYAHFVLEDQPPLHQPRNGIGSPSLTNQVLHYAAATA